MQAATPHPLGHPLLARLPIAAGAVRLRPLRAVDIDDFLACRSDPDVGRHQGWQPVDQGAALAVLQDASLPPWREGDWAQIGIARADDDGLVGDIGLLCEGPAQVRLGFSLARAAQGRGWAQAAARACIDGLVVPPGMTRLRGITDARDGTSLCLLSPLGFLQTSSEDLVFRGEPCADITLEKIV